MKFKYLLIILICTFNSPLFALTLGSALEKISFIYLNPCFTIKCQSHIRKVAFNSVCPANVFLNNDFINVVIVGNRCSELTSITKVNGLYSQNKNEKTMTNIYSTLFRLFIIKI